MTFNTPVQCKDATGYNKLSACLDGGYNGGEYSKQFEGKHDMKP